MKVSKLLLTCLLLSLSFGVLFSLPLSSSGRLYLCDLLAVTYVVWGLVYHLLVRKAFYLEPSVGVAGFLWLFVATLSLLYGSAAVNFGDFLTGLFYLIRWAVYFFVYLVVINDLRSGLKASLVTRLLVITTLLVALFGFIQLVVLPDMSSLDPLLGWDPHTNRLASSFMDPNFTATFLCLGFFTLLPRPKQGVLKGVFLFALLLTFSRSGWLFLALGLAIFGLLFSRKWIIFSLVLLFSAYYFVPRVQTRIAGIPDPTGSAQLRLLNYNKTWELAKDHLGLGVGFNLWRPAQYRARYFTFNDPTGGHSGSGSDSSLLFVLGTTGITGLISYLILFGMVLKSALRGLDKKMPLQITLLTSSVGLLAASQFINALFYVPIMCLWWMQIALVRARGEHM